MTSEGQMLLTSSEAWNYPDGQALWQWKLLSVRGRLLLFYFISFFYFLGHIREVTRRDHTFHQLHVCPSGGMEQSCFRWT